MVGKGRAQERTGEVESAGLGRADAEDSEKQEHEFSGMAFI